MSLVFQVLGVPIDTIESMLTAVQKHEVFPSNGLRILLYGPLIAQCDFGHSGKDNTELGRWAVMTFWGSGGITTRVVCGYIPYY